MFRRPRIVLVVTLAVAWLQAFAIGGGVSHGSVGGDAGLGVQYIEGYTGLHSYAPGETIRFHVSTLSPTFTIKISRVAFPWWNYDPALETVTGIAGEYHPKPSEAWRGAHWPVSAEIVVGAGWATGSYMARFITEDGTTSYHPFYIRPAAPGSISRVAYIGNFNTLAAYNTWGGRDFYTRPRAYEASLLRPFYYGSGKGRTQWHHRMHSHLELMGYALEYITEWDIEQDRELLRNYDVVILAGHHEYVTTIFYDALQDHHDRGGHIASFDADGLYWQVRYEDAGSIVVGYKEDSDEQDPLFGYVNCLVTESWGSPLLQRPAEALRGVQRNKLYYYFEDGDYVVEDASHWIFEGTGVQNGDTFGTTMAIAEQDTITEYSPMVDIVLHAHRDVVKAGKVPPDGVTAAEMYAVYYADSPQYGFPDGNGGMVFTAGTITGWIRELYEQPDTAKVERATRNILDRMIATPPPGHNGDPVPRYCVPCWPDLNGDGQVNTADFLSYLNAWSVSDPIADWNADGAINTMDFIAFLGDWAAGC